MPKKLLRTDRDLNRVTLHRIHRIFERIRSGDFPNRATLAKEIQVSKKTIYRDIEFMKDFMILPIEFNAHHRGYQFSTSVSNFPLLKLTEGELFAIFVGEKALEHYVGTPYEGQLRSTFKKFTAGLSDELSFQWSELQNAISFKSIEVNPVDVRVMQQLVLAIRRRREITFDYRGLMNERFKHRRVHPYELVSVDHQWYLFALDLASKELKKFVPGRMKVLHSTSVTFVKPKDFSAMKHLQNSFGVFSGGKPKVIRIHFDRFGAQLVRERHWHPSQRITELKGGRLELSLVLGGFEEIERWLLSWGEHAQVVAPPELISRLRATMRKCLTNYS
jgi:predicted DNA-binding transcriptional regulator YafY